MEQWPCLWEQAVLGKASQIYAADLEHSALQSHWVYHGYSRQLSAHTPAGHNVAEQPDLRRVIVCLSVFAPCMMLIIAPCEWQMPSEACTMTGLCKAAVGTLSGFVLLLLIVVEGVVHYAGVKCMPWRMILAFLG